MQSLDTGSGREIPVRLWYRRWHGVLLYPSNVVMRTGGFQAGTPSRQDTNIHFFEALHILRCVEYINDENDTP